MFSTPAFAIVFWALLLPSLWIAGSLAGYSLSDKKSLWSGFVKLGLGIGVYGYFLVLTASFGWLNREAALIFFAFNFIFGWRQIKEMFRWLKEIIYFFYQPRDLFSRICQMVLLVTVLFTALFCFLPEISNDALGIQLYFAKVFVKNASISPSFYEVLSYRPLLMSVLYTTGILFHNIAISKFFHWFSGLLLISALTVKISETTQNMKMALFLGLMLWLTPTLMNQITTTYIDAGVSLFIFLGYCIAIESFDDLKPTQFLYAGLMIGLAVAIRSLALGALFAIMIMLSFQLFKQKKLLVISSELCLILGVFISSAYWFLRDWIYTGNPVYPYLDSSFGGSEDLSFLTKLYFQDMGLPKSLSSFLMIPWNVTVKPQYFDYHHWIGPFYLSVLPFVFYAAFKIKKVRPHLHFIFLFTVFWYFTGQEIRYLLPMFPIYLIAASMGLNKLSKNFLKKGQTSFFAKTIACFAIAALLALTARHFRYQFMPTFRLWNSEEYLQKMERTVPLTEWVNKNLPQDSKILSLREPRLFYFDRQLIIDMDFNVRTQYQNLDSATNMAALLKEKGITHILDTEANPEAHPYGRPIDLLLKDARFTQPLIRIKSANVIDRRCEYVIYKLI